jgi:Tfp pilus assembly protein PilN
MIEINLIPDVKQELIKAQRIRAKVIAGSIFIGIMSIGVVALLALYVFTVQTVRSGLADQEIDKGSKQLSDVQDLSKMLTIQNQLTKISDLNSNKKIDSRIFDLLKAIIPRSPNNVIYSNLAIDSTADTITIDGQAANSYAAVEVFKKTIEGAQIKYTDSNSEQQLVTIASDVSTSNVSYGEDTSGSKVLRFTLSFVYAPELFSPNSKNATIVISNSGSNATDSYLGVPTSIFTNRAQDIIDGSSQ